MRFIFRHEYFWFILIGLAIASNATVGLVANRPFSKHSAREISASELRAQFGFEINNRYWYCGTEDGFHYLFHAGPWGNRTLKIHESELAFEGSFPVGERTRVKLDYSILDQLSSPKK